MSFNRQTLFNEGTCWGRMGVFSLLRKIEVNEIRRDKIIDSTWRYMVYCLAMVLVELQQSYFYIREHPFNLKGGGGLWFISK